MKNKNFIFILLTCFLISSCVAQCDNRKAILAFEKDLKAIDSLINNPNVNLKDLPVTIERLENVTNIQSSSDGNYFGKFHPTKEDLKKWSEWFNNNKSKLCWNNKEVKYYSKN